MAINEEVYKNLGLIGFLGALPERIYKHLGSLGHVGTISDRLFKEGGYLSYITNLIGGIYSRYFVTLDPVLNSHYEVATPVTFTGDFEIEVEFSTVTTGTYGIIIGASTTSDNFLALSNTGGLRAQFGALPLNGTILINDGKLHKCKVARISGVVSIFVDGVLDGSYSNAATPTFDRVGRWNASSFLFDGIIANVKFTDQSGASDVTTTFNLDQETSNTESSIEENNSITYINIPQSGRELYILEDAVWVNNNELIVNGDFSSSDGWTEGSSWTIGGGNATCNGAYTLLTTTVGNTVNNSYKVRYTIEDWSSGRIRTSVGGYNNTTYQTGNGTYTEIMTASNPSSNTTFYFVPSLGVLSVDNISVKKVVEVADFTEPLALQAIASRNFVTLDPVLNSHYDMLTAIEFSNDFEIELDFSTTSTSNYNMLLSPNTNTIWIAVRSTGLITFRTAGGDLISTSQIIDGKLHKLKITRVGTTYNIYVDGVLEDSITTTNVDLVKFNYIGKWYNASLQFNGIIANAKFTDKSGASDVVTTFELDEATANTELSTEGSNSVTYVNIPQSARKLFTLENDIWTDAAGNTIEVAP